MTTVVNIQEVKEGYIYCGRGSIFGNPFFIGRDGSRETVLKRHKEWFNYLIRDVRFRTELLKLRDQKLGCFCYPLDCHCDTLADWLNSHEEL